MPKRSMEILTESMFYVLLALRRGELCGTDIASFVERCTNGRVRLGPATLYTILGKFAEQCYIRETAVDGRRRTYVIAPAGLAAYDAELARMRQCLADAEYAQEVLLYADHTEHAPCLPSPALSGV